MINLEETYRLLGLNSVEIKIIEAISLQEHDISSISRITKLPRTSLLYILKKLQKRDLVANIKTKKRRSWKSSLGESLNKLKSPDPSIYTFYKGREELFSVFEKIIDLPRYSRICAIQPQTSLRYALEKLPYDFAIRLNNSIKKNKIIVEGIVHEESIDTISSQFNRKEAEGIFKSFVGRLEDYVKIPHEFINIDSEIYIFQNSAYILNWNKEIGLGINDPAMVSLLTGMFSCVKDLGKRYYQSQNMKKFIASTPPNTLL